MKDLQTVDNLESIFEFASECISFFEQFFQTPYPFDKMDLVFLPEYNGGAMENPGVITFTDRMVFSTTPTSTQITDRGCYITHEIAHMWFGDLVTMKWWNDLWLNESFADFSSFLATSHLEEKLKSTQVEKGWCMAHYEKIRGYEEDKRCTTHPIACQIKNTGEADSIFDGITYQKGNSTMKQLYYMIGPQQFSDNLKIYFEKYKWGNATRSQFLEVIFSGRDPKEK